MHCHQLHPKKGLCSYYLSHFHNRMSISNLITNQKQIPHISHQQKCIQELILRTCPSKGDGHKNHALDST